MAATPVFLPGKSQGWGSLVGYTARGIAKSFIVSGLTFRSLIHFEFIFVYGDYILSRESV